MVTSNVPGTSDAAALHLAALLNSLKLGVISADPGGRIQSWNPAAESLFGFTAGAIGQPLTIVFPPEQHHLAHELLQQVTTTGTGQVYSTWLSRTDGTPLDVSVSGAPIRTADGRLVGVSVVVQDITRERDMESRTRLLAALVESSEDAIVSKDLNGIIRSWNHAAERMFGYTAAEVIGRSIRIIIPRERLNEETYVLRQIRSGVSVEHFETVRRHKNGTLLDISLTVSPIRTASGEIVGVSKIARDISEQKQLVRRIEEASRLKDEFLATLSHELRTPLNAVIGYARMLKSGTIHADRVERTIDSIDRNAQVLLHLVSDVLDMSSIVAGKTRLTLRPCDVVPVLEHALDIVRPAALAKRIELTVNTNGPVPLIRADPDRLRQVFWNLLTNAVKFTPAGGRVSVTLKADHSFLYAAVTDTGVGLAPESLPHIFQRFRQVDAASQAAPGGLGLGLALVRHYVELHGGTVSATSPGPGRGSTFTVALPLPVGPLADATPD